MSQPRPAYHHGDLRNALIAAAVHLVARHGEAGFSLREAAREVGVSANATYRHFSDKSALLTAASADGFMRMSARMRQALDEVASRGQTGPRSVERFKAVGRGYIEFAIANPELFRLMFSDYGTAHLRPCAGPSEPPTTWTLLCDSLDDLVAEGVLTPERRQGAEARAWAVVHGYASLSLNGLTMAHGTPEHEAAREALLDFAVVGLCGSVQARPERA